MYTLSCRHESLWVYLIVIQVCLGFWSAVISWSCGLFYLIPLSVTVSVILNLFLNFTKTVVLQDSGMDSTSVSLCVKVA